MPRHHLLRRLSAVTAVAALVLTGLVVGPGSPAAAEPAPVGPTVDPTVTTDPLPTVQINGVAWSQVVVGTTVFVAGDFTSARPAGSPAGTNETPRTNLLAYDLVTGELLPWAPVVNGPAYAITASPDGKRIYVGGDFTNVNGAWRNRFVGLSAASGGLSAVVFSGANGAVRSIQATATDVYIGGNFTVVGGQDRPRVAAMDTTTGAVKNWRASFQSQQVDAILLSPDGTKLFVGGRFEKVNNVARLGTAAVATSNAALLPWTLGPAIFAYGFSAGIESLATDGTTVYASGFGFLTNNDGSDTNIEGIVAADPNTAAITWVDDCHGDTYSVYANPGKGHVYLTGHPHMCSNFGGFPEVNPRVHHWGMAVSKGVVGAVQPNQQGGYHDLQGYPSPELRGWFPDFTPGTYTGLNQAGFNVTGSGDYVVFGGEFTTVGGVAQQGLVRFATRPVAPGQRGPVLSGSTLQPTAQSHAPGTIQVSWPTNWDKDDEYLTYRVLRDGTATPVYEVTAASRFWDRPRLSFTDTGLSTLRSYTYRVQAVDANGNTVTSPSVSALTTITGSLSTYARTVLKENPDTYLRLGETSGQFQDWTSWSDATVGNGVQRNQTGAVTGDSNRAANFTGASSSRVTSTKQVPGTSRLTVEAWFRTTSTSGGKIVGFTNATGTNDGGNYDRHLYMTPDGRVVWGVYPNTVRTVTSTAAYNDGAWHHVAATLGRGGMQLFLDGALVGANPDVTFGQQYDGYWRVGGDNLGGWPDAGSSNFTGLIDEVAIYDRELDPLTIFQHNGVGRTGQVPNSLPTAAFTATGGVLTASVDGSASTDADGTVADWSWSWGDGSADSTGVTATHDYAPGTWTVTLTVTDNEGGQGTAQQQVVVEAPNQAPTAAFTSSVLRSAATFDAATSSDSDGTVTGYAWDFGDGTTGTGAQAAHTYPTAGGTFPVTLTVTDDEGATGAVTQSVVIVPPVGADAFTRTISGGLGAADIGGAWTGATNLAVNGSAAVFTAPTAGASATARLQGGVGPALSQAVTVVPDKRPTGANAWVLLRGRIVDGQGEYRLKLNLTPSGSVTARLVRSNAAGSETLLLGDVATGVTYTAGTRLGVRLEVVGGSPTTLRARVWAASAPEPATWQLETTDATAGLQVAGHTGLGLITSTSMTNAPYTVRFDDYRVDPVP